MLRFLHLVIEPAEYIDHVGQAVYPATLLPRLGPDISQSAPSPMTTAWARKAADFEVAQDGAPTLRALAISVLDGDHLLGPIGVRNDHVSRSL